jgi:thioredoxin-related protein
MPRFVICLALAALLAFAAQKVRAARDLDAPAAGSSGLELVVLEVPGCIYCPVFRRDVLPRYEVSPRASEVPLRFLDLNDKAADRLELEGPVDVAPTVVLLKDNREIGRIPGYVGPENFFHAVGYLLSRAPE